MRSEFDMMRSIVKAAKLAKSFGRAVFDAQLAESLGDIRYGFSYHFT